MDFLAHIPNHKLWASEYDSDEEECLTGVCLGQMQDKLSEGVIDRLFKFTTRLGEDATFKRAAMIVYCCTLAYIKIAYLPRLFTLVSFCK